MDNHSRLSGFSDAVLGDLHEEEARTADALAEKKKAELGRIEDELLDGIHRKIEEEISNYKTTRNEQLTVKSREYKAALLQKRENIKKSVFDEVKRGLESFMKTSAYEDYFRACAEDAAVIFKNARDISVTLSPGDHMKKHILTSKLFVEGFIEDSEVIGGFSCFSQSLGIYKDYTFSSRLEAEAESFSGTAELIIEDMGGGIYE